jgi:hypothetical protein
MQHKSRAAAAAKQRRNNDDDKVQRSEARTPKTEDKKTQAHRLLFEPSLLAGVVVNFLAH